MARKRLSAPFATESFPAPPRDTDAPIARIAGESAAAAALETLAGEMVAARLTGRMVEAMPLDAIAVDHLVRDRIALDAEEFAALVESLRTHGQRVPVDVVDLGAGRPGEARYGLISGWRRIAALRHLHGETGEARFATVLALIRPAGASGAAYVAMIEENEIRAGLSYYERARIVARAAEAGAFADRTTALRRLFAGASRAKRSKIGSFLGIVDALDGVLRFPAVIPERLGLALAARLSDGGFATALAEDLHTRPPRTAAEELARLSQALRPPRRASQAEAADPAPSIRLRADKAGRLVLSGPGVDDAFRVRLEAWLRDGGLR